MKRLIMASVALLLINGCALTKPTADEVATTYQADVTSQDRELLKEWVKNTCSPVTYKAEKQEISCRVIGDVLIYDVRLTNNRWEWNPQAATSVTKNLITYFCKDPDESKILQSGFAVLVNLKGPNGFAGAVKTHEDCKTVDLAQSK